jgi:hypothetical protein
MCGNGSPSKVAIIAVTLRIGLPLLARSAI